MNTKNYYGPWKNKLVVKNRNSGKLVSEKILHPIRKEWSLDFVCVSLSGYSPGTSVPNLLSYPYPCDSSVPSRVWSLYLTSIFGLVHFLMGDPSVHYWRPSSPDFLGISTLLGGDRRMWLLRPSTRLLVDPGNRDLLLPGVPRLLREKVLSVRVTRIQLWSDYRRNGD